MNPRLLIALAGMLSTVCLDSIAEAEDAREKFGGELTRWEFSAAAEIGAFGTTARGMASGGPIVGPRAANVNLGFNVDGPDTIVEDINAANDIISIIIGPTFGVMTPSLLDVPTQPRLFLDVSVLPTLTLETSVAREGDPGRFTIPTDVNVTAVSIGEPQLGGTGVKITSQHGLQFHAGLGAAFTFDRGDHRVRIKPSFRYSRIENDVSGVTNRAIRVREFDPIIPGSVPRRRDRSLDAYRLLVLSDQFTEVYHGIGPALEIEYTTDERIGFFALSLFIKGAATHILGDRETSFFAANPEFPEESVSYEYRNEPWAYQVSTGIRLRFSPGR